MGPLPEKRTGLFRSILLTVGMRWFDRVLGFASTLVLARILVPADYGLVAMGTVVVGLLDVILDLGVRSALIRDKDADHHDFDTAWTVQLFQAAIVAALVFACAPVAADYFRDHRVVQIMHVLAVAALIGGFENIGIVRFQKRMEFGRDAQFFMLKRTIGVASTIALALTIRSYLALVLGTLATRLTGVALSYAMSRYRPRISFARIRNLWSFSQWNIVISVTQYLSVWMDTTIVGRRSGPDTVGAFSLGKELAQLPTTEWLTPLGRVLFPALAEARHQTTEFRRLIGLAVGIQTMVGVPAAFGLGLVASEAVPLLLGAHWLSAVPFVQIFAVAASAAAFSNTPTYVLMVAGHIRTLGVYYLSLLLTLAALLMVAFPTADAHEVAVLRGAASIGFLILLQAITIRLVPEYSGRSVLAASWRPLIATAAMALAVLTLTELLAASQLSAPRLLLAKVVAGVSVYTCTILFLWAVCGRPAGAEQYLLQKLRYAWARLAF
jgi:O-antigen/teichoic acid export membrane protein